METASVDRRDMQYLYRDGDDWIFMDNISFEQFPVPDAVVGESSRYLLENQTAQVAIYEGNPIIVELPASVEMMLTYTEPGLQGDRSSGGTKPATLETGAENSRSAVHRFAYEGEG